MRLPATIVILIVSTLIVALSVKVILNDFIESDSVTSTTVINKKSTSSKQNKLSEEDITAPIQKQIQNLFQNPTPTTTPTPTPTTSPNVQNSSSVKNPEMNSDDENAEYQEVYVTYYGWHDNDPSGNKIAYPNKYYDKAKHDTAGGKGTYDDPITFATDKELFEVGTILYVPYIKKYIIMEDQCSTCENDYNDGIKHIDIWMNSNEDFEDELYECQYRWTRNKTKVEIDPPDNREINLNPLFNKDNGECLKSI